jgi:hypothetical protein
MMFMHYVVYEKDALEPCPLCGRPVRLTEFTVRNTEPYSEYSAKIECSCGLTFEKEWIQGQGCIFDEDIITLWNKRAALENCEDALFYDEDDAAEFIHSETSIDADTIEKVLAAEMKYMASIGIAEMEGE